MSREPLFLVNVDSGGKTDEEFLDELTDAVMEQLRALNLAAPEEDTNESEK